MNAKDPRAKLLAYVSKCHRRQKFQRFDLVRFKKIDAGTCRTLSNKLALVLKSNLDAEDTQTELRVAYQVYLAERGAIAWIDEEDLELDKRYEGVK